MINCNSVQILDNPTKFTNPFQFEISFDCNRKLDDDLEWKIVYVGSADSEEHDQELDSVLVGPVEVGRNKFVFQANAPDSKKIPSKDLLGVTVVMLICSYKKQEFIRVGYYVNNEYDTQELREDPPNIHKIDRITRNVLADRPRVTRFEINWD
eukprot:TRINITY_DN2694_c0_g1_i1.p1 TRINITY_DN2694_c0_g1~~TRINITY_DN2694_c0_g1_i1.p1  ORF type:complete len:153 (+),score=26.78 TRINITY_DN2694_c0_g1_i1:244-702(+)